MNFLKINNLSRNAVMLLKIREIARCQTREIAKNA